MTDTVLQQYVIKHLQWLLQFGISVADLSKLFGVKETSVRNWMLGHRLPKEQYLEQLELVLQMADAVAEELPEHVLLFFAIKTDALSGKSLFDCFALLSETRSSEMANLPEAFVSMVRQTNMEAFPPWLPKPDNACDPKPRQSSVKTVAEPVTPEQAVVTALSKLGLTIGEIGNIIGNPGADIVRKILEGQVESLDPTIQLRLSATEKFAQAIKDRGKFDLSTVMFTTRQNIGLGGRSMAQLISQLNHANYPGNRIRISAAIRRL
jgi:hypothetical protein